MSTATKGYPEPGNPCIGDQKAPIVITLVFALVLARTVALIIYRLYFSPLSQFPGSRLAAISGWHELYYDLIANGGGQFTFEIKRMHERYGPIVRINPDELHIDDPEFYNEINCGATAAHPIDKIRKFKYRFNVPEATVHTVYSEHHRMRRAAIAPFFSKQRIFSRNGHLQQIVDRISHRFDTEYKGTGKVVNMSDVWATMTADVITELAFARSTNFSAAPDFQSPFSMAMASSVGYAHWTTHFRPFVEMMNWIPDGILGVIVPPFKPILEYRQAISRQIRDILAGKNMDAKETSHPTIFHDILASDLPPEELSFSRLRQEAMSLNGAGIETTMWTLTVGTFHIIDNSDVYHKLKDELTESMPDPDVVLSWVALEKLPYLSAVVQESLRLAFGSVQRLPRVSRSERLTYGCWTIQANVSVSMDAYHNHINPLYFPNPLSFVPERWLNDPKGPDGLQPLGNYMVSFSRGARNCIGMNLALMELYVCLATIFRRHKLELYETTREDVDFIVDLVKPMPKHGSKGVRVLVK